MTQTDVDRFVKDLEKRAIKMNQVDRALLSCFVIWYACDQRYQTEKEGGPDEQA